MDSVIWVVAMVVFAIFVLFSGGGFFLLGRPWLRGLLYGTPVPFVRILAMRLRGNPPLLLIDAYIALQRAGVSATIDDVENVYIDSRTRIVTSDDLAELVKATAAWQPGSERTLSR